MADNLTPGERAGIATTARDIIDDIAGDMPPSLEQSLAMSLEELVEDFRARGVEVDVEAVEATIRQSLGKDVLALNRGAAMDAHKLEALGKKAGRALEQATRQVARETVRQSVQSALIEADERDADAQWYMWVSVGGKNRCRSCEARHGTVAKLDMWEGIEPGKTSTLCEERCRCRLVPCGAPDATQEMTRPEDIPQPGEE